MRHPALALLLALLASPYVGVRAAAWPAPPLPADARVEVVADDMVLNGQPSRVLRFKSAGTPADVLAFYREKFGARHVEHRARDTQVIATRQGEHFVTVQLRPVGGQVQGTVMTTLLRAPGKSATALETEKWLPPTSALLSTMQSVDAGKRSLMVVGANRSSLQANRDHLVAAMGAAGFRVVKEDSHPAGERPAMSVQLSGSGETVDLTISDAGAYRALVINRTREATP